MAPPVDLSETTHWRAVVVAIVRSLQFFFFLTLSETDDCGSADQAKNGLSNASRSTEISGFVWQIYSPSNANVCWKASGVGWSGERYCALYDKSISTLNPPVNPPHFMPPSGRRPNLVYSYTLYSCVFTCSDGFSLFLFFNEAKIRDRLKRRSTRMARNEKKNVYGLRIVWRLRW